MASPHFGIARYLLNYFEVLGKQFYTKNVSGSSSERDKEREKHFKLRLGWQLLQGEGVSTCRTNVIN